MTLSNRIPPGVDLEDLREGAGREAVAGETVRVRCRFFLNRGEEIATDPKSDGITTFRIGDRQTIAGLERGVLGMKVGGLRHLTVSPHLAYGLKGVEGKIPPNAALRIEVEMLEII